VPISTSRKIQATLSPRSKAGLKNARMAQTPQNLRQSPGKVAKLLRGLETYVAGQAALIIDYAAARHDAEPISTAPTESTVQWLLHRRMGANQQMRWSPRGAHMMLKVRTAVANGTFERDYAVAERRARRPFRRAA